MTQAFIQALRGPSRDFRPIGESHGGFNESLSQAHTTTYAFDFCRMREGDKNTPRSRQPIQPKAL